MTQASLALPSGRLLISMQEFDDELPRIRLTPGTYAVRVYSNGLHTIFEDGLDGEDRYHVVLAHGRRPPSPGPQALPRAPSRRLTPPSASDRAQITTVVHVAVAAVERSDDPKETPYQTICGSAASPAKIWLLRH